MRRRLVDASPLIYLARLGRLELLLLGVEEVLVPAVVLAEVRAKRDHSTEQVEQRLDSWLKICERTQADVLRFLPDLGAGEREVMAQALQEGIVSVVLDDLDARRVARRLGLEPVGTVGLLLAAKKPGRSMYDPGTRIKRPACGPSPAASPSLSLGDGEGEAR